MTRTRRTGMLGIAAATALVLPGTLPAQAATNTVYSPKIVIVSSPVTDGYALNGSTITFTDASTAPTRQWDLDGNGTVDSTDKTVSKTYIRPGYYKVKLTVMSAVWNGKTFVQSPVSATTDITIVKSNLTQGTISRTGTADPADGVQSVVVPISWSSCQPNATDGATGTLQPGPYPIPTTDDTGGCTAILDAKIQEALDYNAAHPSDPKMRLKVRIRTGILAPAWVKNLGGGALTGYTCPDGKTYDVPRWWTSQYIDAYQQFVTALGKKYDSTRVISDWTIAGAAVCFTEPMLRITRAGTNASILLAAGYTTAADIASHKRFIDIHDEAFDLTHSSLTMNPFQTVTPAGKALYGDSYGTFEILDYAQRSGLGLHHKLIEENNSVGPGDIPASCPQATPDDAYGDMYCRMRADATAGWPTHYQTETSAKISQGPNSTTTDLCLVLQGLAVNQHALDAELPRSTPAAPYDTTASCIKQWDTAMESNTYSR